MTHTNASTPVGSATTLDGNMSNPAIMPALGMTHKDLPDRLRPEVVDIDVLENLAAESEMESAAPSDGTGTSGNINPQQQPEEASPSQGPAIRPSLPPQQL